jgi:hypothetical protein
MERRRIFKSRRFDRFARREGIPDATLRDAIERAERGQIDADLGGGVIKQRIARPGEGRSGGYRTIVLFRRGRLAFFVRGFGKSEQANIDASEVTQFKELARIVLSLTVSELDARVTRGDLVEVQHEENI